MRFALILIASGLAVGSCGDDGTEQDNAARISTTGPSLTDYTDVNAEPQPSTSGARSSECNALVESFQGPAASEDFEVEGVGSASDNRVGFAVEPKQGRSPEGFLANDYLILQCRTGGVWYDSHLLVISATDEESGVRAFDEVPINTMGEGGPKLPFTGWVTIPAELTTDDELRISIPIFGSGATSNSTLLLGI